jgi:integrase/recombinase XerD
MTSIQTSLTPPGKPQARSGPTLASAAVQFVDHCRVAKALSPHTLRAYSSDLADFARFSGAGARVARIDRAAVRTYARSLLDDRDLKETTVRRRIATLKVFFRWLEREEYVPLSVFHRLEFSIRTPRLLPRALERREIRDLLAVAKRCARADKPTHDSVLIHFALVVLFTTGLRISELVSARLSDLDPNEGLLRVRGKGNRERRVYFSGSDAKSAMNLYLATRDQSSGSDGYLIATENGRPVSTQRLRRRLRALGAKAGIGRRVTPHMLRHTAATQLIDAGVGIRFVQRLLGHSSIVTTQIYAEVHDASLKAVLAKADTLGRLVRH